MRHWQNELVIVADNEYFYFKVNNLKQLELSEKPVIDFDALGELIESVDNFALPSITHSYLRTFLSQTHEDFNCYSILTGSFYHIDIDIKDRIGSFEIIAQAFKTTPAIVRIDNSIRKVLKELEESGDDNEQFILTEKLNKLQNKKDKLNVKF